MAIQIRVFFYSMGRTNSIIIPWYREAIKQKGETALLGFTNTSVFYGDLYDQSIGNWEINSEWDLSKKYDTIICTRCAYFAKDPEDFIVRCYNSLNPNGTLYVDWGLGDHWRFENYKIGWVKDGEHEYAYNRDNYLWSVLWDDSFVENEQYKIFQNRVSRFGYDDLKLSIDEEVPSVMELSFVEKYFSTDVHILTCWEDFPQIYILLVGVKK